MDSKPDQTMRSMPDTLKAVAWSFIGLRRKKDFDRDAGNMNPLYVVVCALTGVALFIGALLAVVHTVT